MGDMEPMGGQRPYRGRYGEKEPIGDIEAMGGQRPYRGHWGDSDPIGDIMGELHGPIGDIGGTATL